MWYDRSGEGDDGRIIFIFGWFRLDWIGLNDRVHGFTGGLMKDSGMVDYLIFYFKC